MGWDQSYLFNQPMSPLKNLISVFGAPKGALILALSLTLCACAATGPTSEVESSQPTVQVDVKFIGQSIGSAVDRKLQDRMRTNVLAFLKIYTQTRKGGRLDRLKALADPSQVQKRSNPNVSQLHKLAQAEISQALQPFGFYKPVITGFLENPLPKRWQATYTIDPGPRVAVKSLNISMRGLGAQLPVVKSGRANLRLKVGDPLDHQIYETSKTALQSLMYDEGFLDATYTAAKLGVDVDGQIAEVDWQLDSGPQFYFDRVLIKQNILHEQLVNRYHDIQPGEPFNFQRLIDLQIALNNTNYFDGVALNVDRSATVNSRIPVSVKTIPRSPRKYSAGVGFGTDTGPRVSAGVDFKRVNKRGHRSRIDARLSGIGAGAQFEYIVPIKRVQQDKWLFYASAERADVADAETDLFAIGSAREDSWGPFRRRMFVNIEQENFTIGDQSSQQSLLIYPGLTLSYDKLDNPQFVRRGFSIASTLISGQEGLGSDVDFTKLSVSGRIILPLGPRMRVLTGVELGHVDTSSFEDLPPSQRLYAGGDRSVRGYGYQQISPMNSFGDDIGGTYLMSANMEVDYSFTDTWGVAAFIDIGEASMNWPKQFQKGIGLGVRYRSPVGMIRIDLAHPLDDPDNSLRLHLSIGPDL